MPLDPQLFPAGNVDRNATLVRAGAPRSWALPSCCCCVSSPPCTHACPGLTLPAAHLFPQIPAANLMHTGEEMTTLIVSCRPTT